MSRPFWSRLFASTPALAPDVRDALEQLEQLATQRPSLHRPIVVLRELLPDLCERDSQASCALTEDTALQKLRQSLPVLRNEPVQFDVRRFERVWRRVCEVLQRQQNATPAGAILARWLERPEWRAERLVAAVLAGRSEDIRSRAAEAGCQDTLPTVLRLTLFPVLSPLAASTERWWSAARWPHGFCPACGSWPLLAELRGLEQTRYLRCGLCAASWEFPRLQCPFCATTDHNELGYLHATGEELRYRVSTCAACQGYLKTIQTLGPLRSPQLFVADLATTHLDLVAQDRGFLAER